MKFWSLISIHLTSFFAGYTNETPRDYHCNLGSDGRRRDADEKPELCRGTVEFVATKEYTVGDLLLDFDMVVWLNKFIDVELFEIYIPSLHTLISGMVGWVYWSRTVFKMNTKQRVIIHLREQRAFNCYLDLFWYLGKFARHLVLISIGNVC